MNSSRRVPLPVIAEGRTVLRVVVDSAEHARARFAPRRAVLVLRDDDGILRAYYDECRHLPIPLGAGGESVTNEDGLLECKTHGALYRRDTGECVLGPCFGRALKPVRIEDDALLIDD